MNDLRELFWSRVQKGEGCWFWTAGRISTGYGAFVHYKTRTSVLAHRFAYNDLIGPIPDGLVIDHLCNNKICVNPAHLRVTTHRENILRGTGQSAINAKKTHCPYGHELFGNNMRYDKRGRRICKACHSKETRDDYHRHIVARRLSSKIRQRKWRAQYGS